MYDINHKYISIDVIASRLKKHPMLRDINYEDIISHTVDVLRLINMPPVYEEKVACKDIVDYKVLIPQDSLAIKSVDYKKTDTNYVPNKEGSNRLHNHLQVLPENNNNTSVFTYTQNNGMLHCNQKEGEVLIVYDALVCDKNGVPMIPDNIPVIKAIENYIKVEIFSMYVDMGKMGPRSLQRVEQEYAWYIGKAQTQFQGFNNEDSHETYISTMVRLFNKNTSHKNREMYNVNRELKYKKR